MTQPAVESDHQGWAERCLFLERYNRKVVPTESGEGFSISMHAISLDCIRIWNSI